MFTGTYTLAHTDTALNAFAITDTSDYTGESKASFSGRRVYFQLTDGTFYQDGNGNDYWDFSFTQYPDGVIEFVFLTEDIALATTVKWIPITPVEGSTYEAKQVYAFTDYLEQFALNIALSLENNKSLASVQNWMQSASALQAYIDCAANRETAQDQYSCQQAIVAGTYISNNVNLFY